MEKGNIPMLQEQLVRMLQRRAILPGSVIGHIELIGGTEVRVKLLDEWKLGTLSLDSQESVFNLNVEGITFAIPPDPPSNFAL